MGAFIDLWRRERAARPFFLALIQSGLGTGAAYVGIMVVAYDRLGSAWAATLVLLADLLPGMLLGPLVGAWLDRRDRRHGAILADGLRAAALAGMVVVPGAAGLLALALVAGLGGTIFRPAVFGLLPSLVAEERRMPALALWGAVGDAGMTLGPALAAACIALGGASLLLLVDAAAFAGCALAMTRVRVSGVTAPDAGAEAAQTLVSGAREGLRFLLADRVLRVLIAGTGGLVLCAGMMNVAEVLLARHELRVSGTGFAAMVAVFGVGMVAGSLLSGRSRTVRRLKLGYLGALAILGCGLLGSAVAPSLAFALVSFWVTGLGDSASLVHNRGLIQQLVPERLLSRAHAVNGTIESWAFAGAALLGGGQTTIGGARGVFAVSGAGVLLLAGAAAWALSRGAPERVAEPALAAA
jgi:MFS family permease